jgi:hypothetical protein
MKRVKQIRLEKNVSKIVMVVWTTLIGFCGYAQLSNNIPRIEDRSNAFSFSASYGEILEREAWFYGFSGEYARRLKKAPVGFAGSLMWDSEKDEIKDKTVGTFTAAVTGSYLLGKRFSIGTGLGKGFADTDNPDRKYKFTNGDWTTALFGGYQIPLKNKASIGISLSYEYNLSAKENSLSIDLAFGIPF